MPTPDFFALYDLALNMHTHLILEVGYNRIAGWGVHLYDGTGLGIAKARSVFSVQSHKSRDETMALAFTELCKAYPDVAAALPLSARSAMTNHGSAL